MCQYTTATHLIDTSRCEHGHMTDQLRDRRALRRRRPERQTHTQSESRRGSRTELR